MHLQGLGILEQRKSLAKLSSMTAHALVGIWDHKTTPSGYQIVSRDGARTLGGSELSDQAKEVGFRGCAGFAGSKATQKGFERGKCALQYRGWSRIVFVFVVAAAVIVASVVVAVAASCWQQEQLPLGRQQRE